jgi:hypothetical protein
MAETQMDVDLTQLPDRAVTKFTRGEKPTDEEDEVGLDAIEDLDRKY